ncbi:MAG: putative DNA binding domain-containing protein [Gammaproteobacteria bacterium]|nr:putative DNA binding domain-containing protein [Gammaproteobacteria bacterium]
MFDSTQELLEKIRLGESTFLEFKDVRFRGDRVSEPSRDRLADALAALANSSGGVFVLGVEDRTHEVVGIPDERLDAVVEYVRNLCTDSIKPPLGNLVLDRIRLPSTLGEEVAVVKVDVPRSLFVHQSPGGYLHRLADAKVPMSPEYLARLFQQRSQTRLIRFDEQPVDGARLEHLSPDLVERLRSPRSDEDQATFLGKLGMARMDEDGTVRPTVAGVLMAAENPRLWLPSAYIQAVAYRGDRIQTGSAGSAYQLDAQDFGGPLDSQIQGACRFVARNMRTAATKDQGRVDLPQYDMSAVFEAIVNAVAHRDYSIHGERIRLRLFDSRLELYSPGAIPNSLSIDSLRFRQSARNEAICSLLTLCKAPGESWLRSGRSHMMEKRGEGVPIILDNSAELSGQEPEYRLLDQDELLLTIYARMDQPVPSSD